MSDTNTSITQAIGIWAVLAGVVLTAAIAVLFATVPVWGWVTLVVFVLLSGTAMSGFTDPASRAFLAGTLRKSTYTQIYTTLTRRAVLWLWGKVCDPADDRAGMLPLFRAALTWRLYDAALLIAVAYPILLLVGQWVVTGQDGRIGSFVLLEAAPFWWDRAIVVGFFAILILGLSLRKLALPSPHGVIRQAADWLPLTAVIFAFVFVFPAAGAVPGALAVGLAVSVVYAGAGALAAAAAAAIAAVIAFIGARTGAVAVALVGAGALGLALTFALVYLETIDRQRAVRWLVTICVTLIVLGTLTLLDFTAVPEDRRSLFVFLAVLPLLNALFDTLSYAVTLTLMRRGLRAAWPVLWGLLDLAVACGLFLALGMTLVVTIHALNLLAGVPLVDLPALLAGVHTDPGAYVWLYLMLFSTIIPTALHAGLSLLGVQGIWPRRLRRPVAGWVSNATASPLHALRAGLALGVIWTLPLVVFGFVIWAAWHYLGGVVIWLLSRYFDALLWLAAVPAGAV